MGALTSNRKRGDEYLSHGTPSANSPNFRSSKKPRLLFPPMNPTPDRSATPMSPKSAVARVSRYPEVKPLHRLHAPCGNNRFESNWGVSNRHLGWGPRRDSGYKGIENLLLLKYQNAKSMVFEKLRYFRSEKEVVELDREVEEVGLGVSEDSSLEEIQVGHRDDDQHGTVDGILRESDAKIVDKGNQPSSSSAAADLINAKVSSLSLGIETIGMSVAVYKKLLRSAEERDPKINQLDFDIQLNEQKLDHLQSMRPAKKQAEEATPVEPFVELTKEEEAQVSQAFSCSRRKVLAAHENSNIEITGQILQCLRPGAWLNDEVINVYLELLKEREKRDPKKFLKCHFFNTFFYKKLISGNGYDYKSVRRWTTQRKLGYGLIDCDKIFVPVHREVHWCLAVINKKEEKFQYLDSLKGGDKQVTKVLARYYVDEVKDKSGKDINVSSWKHECIEDLPEQMNGFDCGVFMIKYADFYSRGLGLCFSQQHMPYFRLRTAKEILRLRAD